MIIGMWKEVTFFHLKTIRRYVVVPMLSRLVEYNASLQVIGFPTSLGMHQQTPSAEKSNE